MAGPARPHISGRFARPPHTAAGGVIARLEFAVALAQLLFDLLGHQIHRRVQVALAILRVEVRPRHRQADGAGKLALRPFEVVVFQRHVRAGAIVIQMLQFFDAGKDVIFDGFGQSDIVWYQNELHTRQCAPSRLQNPVFCAARRIPAFARSWVTFNLSPFGRLLILILILILIFFVRRVRNQNQD